MDTTDPVGSVSPTAPSPATPTAKPTCAACREVCRCMTHPVWQLRFWLCDYCARLPGIQRISSASPIESILDVVLLKEELNLSIVL